MAAHFTSVASRVWALRRRLPFRRHRWCNSWNGPALENENLHILFQCSSYCALIRFTGGDKMAKASLVSLASLIRRESRRHIRRNHSDGIQRLSSFIGVRAFRWAGGKHITYTFTQFAFSDSRAGRDE